MDARARKRSALGLYLDLASDAHGHRRHSVADRRHAAVWVLRDRQTPLRTASAEASRSPQSSTPPVVKATGPMRAGAQYADVGGW